MEPVSPLSVHVVEDDPAVRLIVVRMLQLSGFAVESSGTGEEAALAIERQPPDVALVDVRLPLASGIDLAAFIHDLAPGTRVLLMSGYDADDLARMGVPEGTPLIFKPFTRDELPRAVRAVAGGELAAGVPRFGGPQPH